MKKNKLFRFFKFIPFLLIIFLTSCSENQSIVNDVSEKEANEILVFLASNGIAAQKMKSDSSQTPGAGASAAMLWNISVDPNKVIEAMALLNEQGLPRRKGITLLDLFAKDKLMSSDKEETIKYQAGLEEELKNIIRKIDGIIDADVQISFPTTEIIPGATPPKAKASVYVKHHGILDDPNSHLEVKIKRLIAGAVENLSFEDVAVISDRSKLTASPLDSNYLIGANGLDQEYVKIWSIVMPKQSASTFRSIFFIFIVIILTFGGIIGYLIYKFYPLMQKQKTAEEEHNKKS